MHLMQQSQIISIFTYLSVLYDVDIEALACILSSCNAMLCYFINYRS